MDHKRAFLREYQRWAMLFRGKDTGDTESEKWLIAEYYESLQHLSEEGFAELTKLLKANCTFFPTVRECLDLMRPKDRYDWGHPFLAAHKGQSTPLLRHAPPPRVLATQSRPLLTDDRHDV
ncbi:MAG: hypothetical protein EBR45_01605 [Betaproteobacteria bacterium]|nr:hypothetical protein [Betaproteobacteria bacterium]